MNKTRVGIVGYGNLGRGVENAISQNTDIELVAIFTRREGSGIKASVPVVGISGIADYKGKIDVMILCGGSATDLPEQTPAITEMFNTIDSFDTHAKIPEHFKAVDTAAKNAGTCSIISCGWDPGLFSLNRVLGASILPEGNDYTFWGKGVSQGHSDAVRRIDGVKNAVQYTVPTDKALELVRTGTNPELSTRDKHERVCYVVAKEGADTAKIQDEIVSMPNYFADYNTTVNFIDEQEFNKNHTSMPHGGFVIRTGKTGNGNTQKIEFNLALDSNPEFTASVLVAYTRAITRLVSDKKSGCFTVFDVPPAYLSQKSSAELMKEML